MLCNIVLLNFVCSGKNINNVLISYFANTFCIFKLDCSQKAFFNTAYSKKNKMLILDHFTSVGQVFYSQVI